MTTDITELKERERELERYETVLETVPDGVFLLDGTATVIAANRRGAEMVGDEPGSLEGRRIDHFIESGVFAPEVRERYEELLATLLSSENDQVEATYTHEVSPVDGEQRLVEAHVTVLPYEEDYRGLVSVFRDVTERERARAELERQNEHLEQFASVVSHDLRNPLNIANSRVELARETGDLDHLDDAVAAHERMDRLIDDILQLARQGRLVRTTESVSLRVATLEAWSQVQAPDATLEPPAEGAIEADPDRLAQLLENCLHNAVRHGGSEVTVAVGWLGDDGPTRRASTWPRTGRASRLTSARTFSSTARQTTRTGPAWAWPSSGRSPRATAGTSRSRRARPAAPGSSSGASARRETDPAAPDGPTPAGQDCNTARTSGAS